MKRKGSQKNPIVGALKGVFEGGFEQVGKFYSIYRGVVIDNEDPEHLHRLQLIIPQVTGNEVYEYWAYARNVPSDENFGAQIIPPKGSMVWVEFEGGEPEIPVWSHGHFAVKEIPKTDPDLIDPNCYWFTTKKGHKVKINDTKNYIQVTSSQGDVIELNEKAISLITKRQISLGTLNKSAEPAVLGDKTKDLLKDLTDIVGDLHAAMVKDIAKYTSLQFVNSAKAIPLQTAKVKTLKEKLDKILSTKVTLD